MSKNPYTIVAYDIHDEESLKSLSDQEAIGVGCKPGFLYDLKLEPHLSLIDNLNLFMLDKGSDIIIVAKRFQSNGRPIADIANGIPAQVGIVGQLTSLYYQSALGATTRDVVDATLLFGLDQVAPMVSDLFYCATPDIAWIDRRIIERTRGFDPDLGVTIEGMADLSYRAYNLCGLYTWLSPSRVSDRYQCEAGKAPELEKKYGISGLPLLDTIRRIFARKILTT